MKSTENLERIIKALEKLPDSYETEHALKQNGYVEGVCDSINTVVKLFIHSVSNRLTKQDLETIKEHRDLMNDVVTGDYKPDSFTTQPINNLIDRIENGC